MLPPKIRRLKPGSTIALLIAMGTLLRIYAAICFQNTTNSDIGINALMVRHIAIGKHFPLFFYGQSYMGTLEAWLGAPIYLTMGHRMLAVLLGSALTAALSQWFLYRWVRDISNHKAALITTALYIFGSPALFYYNIFLGYPALLLFGLICCSLSIQLVKEMNESATGARIFQRTFFLGLMAGVGWWCNNMILVFFPACLLSLLAGIRLKQLPRIIPGGIIGFTIGAGPWLYMALTDPATLFFLRQGRAVSISHTTSLVWHYTAEALGLLHRPLWLTAIEACAGILAVTVYLAACIRSRDRRQAAFYLMPLIIILTNALVCMRSSHFSHVPASRYMLPMLPALFAIYGIAVNRLANSYRAVTGWTLAAVLILCQWYAFPFSTLADRPWQHNSPFTPDNNLAKLCQQHNIAVLRAGFRCHWMNFASVEKFTVCTYPDYDRYRPYRQKAFTADNIAVVGDFMNFSEFIKRTACTAAEYQTRSFHVYAYIRQTNTVTEYIPNKVITCSETGLLDRDVSTPGIITANNLKPRHGNLAIKVSFSQPVSISGIRAIGYNGRRARIRQIRAASGTGTNLLYRESDPDNWFMSGPRPYGGGPLNYAEYRFTPCSTTNLELIVPFDKYGQLKVTELLFIAATEAPPDYQHNLLQLEQTLAKTSEQKIFCSRWLTEKINHDITAISTVIPPTFYQQYNSVDRCRFDSPIAITNPACIIIVAKADRQLTAKVLQAAGFTIKTQTLAQWTLFTVTRNNPLPDNKHLLWTELGPFFYDAPLPGQIDQIPVEAQTTAIKFENGIRLEALQLKTIGAKTIEMHWFWSCPPQVDTADLAIFVHFKAENGTRFQDDRIFLPQIPHGGLPVRSGRCVFLEKRQIEIPQNATGKVITKIGIYHSSTGKRLNSSSHYKTSKHQIELPPELSLHISPTPR